MLVELAITAAGLALGTGAGWLLARRSTREQILVTESHLVTAESELDRLRQAEGEADNLIRRLTEQRDSARDEAATARSALDALHDRVRRLDPDELVGDRIRELSEESRATLARMRVNLAREKLETQARDKASAWVARMKLGKPTQEQVERWHPVVARIARDEPELFERAWDAVGLPAIPGGE